MSLRETNGEPTLRFLGEMEVLRAGRPVALPRSRETRALLAYLALTARPQRREHLCELLWGTADDAPGALEESAGELRDLLDAGGEKRLRAEHDTLALDAAGAHVDLLWARAQVAGGLASLAVERLAEVAAEFRGELLAGLDATDLARFHAWCAAEREDARALHADVLRTLVARLEHDPEAAVPHARMLARVAPLDEAALAHAVRVLFASGRRDEAERQYEAGRRALEAARVPSSGVLLAMWRRLGRTAAAPPVSASVGATSGDASADAPPAAATPAQPTARVPRTLAVPAPATRYARSGDVSIAYQVVGEGPDVVLIPGWVSHVEEAWDEPSYARFLERLRSFCRLILFDRRGTGLSDRVAELPMLEVRMDDIRVVMEAAGARRATLFGISEGGPLAMLFAATHPERTTSLVLYGTFARGSWHPDYPWRWTLEQWEEALAYIGRNWGTGKVAAVLAPSIASDPKLVAAWGRFERMCVSPGSALALLRMSVECDVRHVLPAIHAPTLVLQRTGDQITTVPGARYIADRVAGARYVELPGVDHFPWIGDYDAVLDEVQEFVTGARAVPHADRVLATVLFVDIASSTSRLAEIGDRAWSELLGRFRETVRDELDRFRGREIDTAGDSFLATFDGPARAVRCATAIRDAVSDLGLAVRSGLHTGECEVQGGRIAGIAVHIGARVAEAAEPGEVLVSSTVKDLVAGSGLEFASRGTRTLAGVPGEWQLFRVARA